MSFFGYMAAGAADGAGRGMVAEADIQERLAAKMEQQRAGASDRMELQRQRLDDQSALKLTLAGMREEGRDGRGRGKGGPFNLAEQAIYEDDPVRLQRMAGVAGMLGGDDAEALMLDKLGMPRMSRTTPTTGDLARYDRTLDENGASEAPVPAAVMERARYDKQEGVVALQQVMALAMDPAKLKSLMDGQAQGLRNDVTSKVTLPDALKAGDRTAGAMNEALSPLNPKAGLDGDKNSLAAERNSIRQQEADDRNRRGESSLDARGRDLLIKERKGLEKTATSYTVEPSLVAAAKTRMAEIDADLRKATAPPTVAAPGGKRSAPSDAASKYRAAQKAGQTW